MKVPASVRNGAKYFKVKDNTNQSIAVVFHHGAMQNVSDGMFFVLVILNVIVRCG